MLTNHPVRKIGLQPYRRIPLRFHLIDVQQACELELERDLRDAPTPISRHAEGLGEGNGASGPLPFKMHRRYREPDRRRAYGILMAAAASTARSNCRTAGATHAGRRRGIRGGGAAGDPKTERLWQTGTPGRHSKAASARYGFGSSKKLT